MTLLIPASNRSRLRDRTAQSALLEFQSSTAALLATPVSPAARGTVWVVLSMVVATFAALALIPMNMVVTGFGRVVSLKPTIVVQPLETSIVREIAVHEGQVVKAGEVLARLDPTFAGADAGALETQVRSFSAEVDRLSAEAQGSEYAPAVSDASTAVQSAIFAARRAQFRSQLDGFEQKISSLQAQLTGAQTDQKAFQQRLAIAISLEDKKRELEQLKVGSQINRLIAQDARIEVQRNLDDAAATGQRTIRDLAQVAAEVAAFKQNWISQVNQQLSERYRSLKDAQESLAKARLRHELVDLRAEQAAVVLTIAKVSVGSVMQSGDQFFSLVPLNSAMSIEARIPGNDAGYVRVGQPATIKFDTFPFVRYGVSEGSVQSMSADSFTLAGQETQRSSLATASPSTAYYTGHISIDRAKMHGVPGGFDLRPGMPVTVDIEVGRRTALLYLMGEVLTVGREGMREP